MGCEPLFDYRKKIINHLLGLYKGGEYHAEIESLLMDYCSDRSIKTDNSILRNEFDDILKFFQYMLCTSLYHCLIANHIREIGRKIKCNYGNELTPFFRNRGYQVYRMLYFDRKEWIDMDYSSAHTEHRKLIVKKTRNYILKDYQFLFRLCNQYRFNHKICVREYSGHSPDGSCRRVSGRSIHHLGSHSRASGVS